MILKIWHYASKFEWPLGWGMSCILILGWMNMTAFADASGILSYQQLVSQAEKIPVMIKEKMLERSRIPDPHWRKDACLACHTKEPVEGAAPLKVKMDRTCLYCHLKEDHVVIHPVNLTADKIMRSRLSADFRKKLSGDNKTNCLTCHNILIQCKKKATLMRLSNKPFLRGGYFSTRTGFCYQCHDKGAYKKLNPHDQISDKGVLNNEKCLICHIKVPQQHTGLPSAATNLHLDSNREEICLNCHRWQPHPGGNMTFFSGGKPPNHLVVPSQTILARLNEMTRKNNIGMPLEPGTGRVYCATCHNPHERGVIKNASLAKGADEKKRLRSKQICINCHEK